VPPITSLQQPTPRLIAERDQLVGIATRRPPRAQPSSPDEIRFVQWPRRYDVILRYDRLGVEIPAGDRDPAGGMAVQELMSGRFGEMSTLMNYTFQSFGFPGARRCARSTT
jgi:hypothetical protein